MTGSTRQRTDSDLNVSRSPLAHLVERLSALSIGAKAALAATIVTFLTAGCSLLEQKNFSPDDPVPPETHAYLVEIEAISEAERVLYFSSNHTVETSGKFLTDQRVGSYWLTGAPDEQENWSVPYDEVESASLAHRGGTFANDIEIVTTDGTARHVYVSSDKDFVDAFFVELQHQIDAA